MSTHNLTRSSLSIAAASSFALASAVPSAAALVSIGDFADLYFNGSVTARYDDNIYLQPQDEESDVIFIFAPGLELNIGNRANSNINLYYRHDFYRYIDNSNLDTDISNFFLDAYYNLPRLDLRLNGTFQQLIQPEPNTLAFQAEPGLIERDFYHVNLRGEYEISERFSAASGASVARVEFKDRLDGYFNDTDSFSVPFNLYYALTPRFDVSAGYRYRFTDVKRTDLEYQDHYGNLGIRGEVLPKLMGEGRVGYQQRRIRGGDNNDGLSFGADFSHFLTPKITLLAGAYRDFEAGGTGTSIVSTGGSLGARYSFNQLISAHGGVNYFERRYDQDTAPAVWFDRRKDDTLDLNVGVTYSPTIHVNLSAGYIFRTNDSTIDGFDFDNNIFNVSASLRY
jgi:polysaccharide biosynthesis protein VpsM